MTEAIHFTSRFGETHDAKCNVCQSQTILLLAPADWTVPEQEPPVSDDVSGDGYVEVAEEFTAHYCPECGKVTGFLIARSEPMSERALPLTYDNPIDTNYAGEHAAYERGYLDAMAKLLSGLPELGDLPVVISSWRKAELDQEFGDGDQLLVAVPVNCRHGGKPYWEYYIVVVSCDSEHFSMHTNDGDWGWEWSDVEWWMPFPQFVLPVIVSTKLNTKP